MPAREAKKLLFLCFEKEKRILLSIAFKEIQVNLSVKSNTSQN